MVVKGSLLEEVTIILRPVWRTELVMQRSGND